MVGGGRALKPSYESQMREFYIRANKYYPKNRRTEKRYNSYI